MIIGQRTLTCFNHVKKIALLMDDRTYKFITCYVAPVMQATIRSLARRVRDSSDPAADKAIVPELPLAPFNFEKSPTPSIRDRVTWSPRSDEWEVHWRNEKIRSCRSVPSL